VRLNKRIVDGNYLDVAVLNTVQGISVISALAWTIGKKQLRGTYALRKTILPILPKPLIPTSVSGMIVYNEGQPRRCGSV